MFGYMFGDMFSFGQIKEAHGKAWIVLKSLNNGFYLASEEGAAYPCDVKLILVASEYNAAVERKKKLDAEDK